MRVKTLPQKSVQKKAFLYNFYRRVYPFYIIYLFMFLFSHCKEYPNNRGIERNSDKAISAVKYIKLTLLIFPGYFTLYNIHNKDGPSNFGHFSSSF